MPLSLRLSTALPFAIALLGAIPVRADKLAISSTPPGATVEIDGVKLGVTPFEKDYPGGYFHRTKTAMGARLEHPLVARLSLSGYSTKEIALTEGPMEWLSIRGARHGNYWLFKSRHFEAALDSIAATFTGNLKPRTASAEDSLDPGLSLESLAALAKPAVVQLKGLQKLGSGFFVTDTGLIATNAHVARDEETLLVLLASGDQLEGKVAYIDPELDVALVKVSGEHFPCLPLARTDSVQQGETVMAIGNPGDAMQFSMTKGIVSAVGRFPSAGPGTWVQTDAPINPGNSGGPLVNLRGEVVGMNTQKLIKKNVNGIGFALSAGDLLSVLERFYPVAGAVRSHTPQEMAAPNSAEQPDAQPQPATFTGKVSFVGTEGARIYLDDRPVGDIPSTLVLPPGRHRVRVTFLQHADLFRVVDLFPGGDITLHFDF